MPRQKSTHVDDPIAVGRRLREARERAGLSQRQLSFAGCSPAYISRIEAGARIPSLQLLRELGRRVGVSEDFLATGTDAAAAPLLLLDAELALRLADPASAETLLRRALEQARDDELRARAVAALGRLALRCGEPRTAIDRLEEALSTLGSPEENEAIAETLGQAYRAVGETEVAISIFDRCLDGAVARDDPLAQIRFASLLAEVLVESGDAAGAEEHLSRVLPLIDDTRDPAGRARIHWAHARRQMSGAAHDAVILSAWKALALLEDADHGQSAANAHRLLAQLELERGRPAAALEIVRRARLLLGPAVSGTAAPLLDLEEARTLVALGRHAEAGTLALAAAANLTTPEPVAAGRAYCVAAAAATGAGEPEAAVELYDVAIELLTPRPTRYLLDAYSSLAELLESRGDAEGALATLKQAVRVQAEIGRSVS
jgi:tetratricopeptide (TPR) repeat protein